MTTHNRYIIVKGFTETEENVQPKTLVAGVPAKVKKRLTI